MNSLQKTFREGRQDTLYFKVILYVCRYASKVLEVYKVNEELNKQLKDVSLYTAQFGKEAGCIPVTKSLDYK